MTTALLRWVNPTQRVVDDAPIAARGIKQIYIFDSASPFPNGVPTAVVPGTDEIWQSDVLSPGTHNFSVVAIDADGLYSAASKIATAVVEAAAPLGAPKAPSGLVVQLRDSAGKLVPPKSAAASSPPSPAPAPAAPKAP